MEKFIENNFDRELVYGDNDKYITIKIKVYDDNVNTNFQDKGMPKEKASCKCLSIIMLDSVVNLKTQYYPQTFQKECKHEIKKD